MGPVATDAAGQVGGVDAPLRRTLAGTLTRPVWALFLVVAVPFALGVSVPQSVAYVPLVASALLFGMPHGAVDHVATARLAGVGVWRGLAVVTVPYVLLGGAYLGAWYLAPAVAAAAFVALTWFHWGQGDVYFLLAVTGERPRTRTRRLLALVVRGGLPMVVPLVAAPDVYRGVVAEWADLFGADLAPIAPLFGPEARLALGGGLAALTLLSLALGAGDPGWGVDAVELAVLWAFFLVVPPVLAVGLYFCLWHSPRHVARVMALDDTTASALRAVDLSRALWRFGRAAAPLTVAALALVGAFALLVPSRPSTLSGWVGLYLVGIAVLTLPHAAVVTWMDRCQGVWTPS